MLVVSDVNGLTCSWNRRESWKFDFLAFSSLDEGKREGEGGGEGHNGNEELFLMGEASGFLELVAILCLKNERNKPERVGNR